MRLRRLCLLIFVFLRFLMDPMVARGCPGGGRDGPGNSFVSADDESGSRISGGLQNEFVQGIFNDSLRTQLLEFRDNLPDDSLVNHSLHCHPSLFSQAGNRRTAEGR